MKRALLIGINEYPDEYKLTGCIEDIDNLADAIEYNGNKEKNFDIKKLSNIQSSPEAMTNIKRLFHDDIDVALLYFSGHGHINASGGQLVFPEDVNNNDSCGIKMHDIMNIVNNSKVKNKIIILDCCHSGDIGNYNDLDDTCLLSSGTSILSACRKEENAMEIEGHGVFTKLLCTALKGGAADFSGNITIGGIYAYIDRSLGAWQQRPVFKTNVTEFIPLKTVIPKISDAEIKKLIELFANPETELPLDPSFEYTNDPSIEHIIVKPYADKNNVEKFKILQKLESIGFVEPINEEHMYFAAMNSQKCKLTELGKFYWKLVEDKRI